MTHSQEINLANRLQNVQKCELDDLKADLFLSRVEVKSQPNPNTSSLTESYGVRYPRAVGAWGGGEGAMAPPIF